MQILSLILLQKLKKEALDGTKCAIVGQINKYTPFLYGDEVRSPEEFDILLDGPEFDYPFFAVPKPAVDLIDHAIGLNISTLIKDGGTKKLVLERLPMGLLMQL